MQIGLEKDRQIDRLTHSKKYGLIGRKIKSKEEEAKKQIDRKIKDE